MEGEAQQHVTPEERGLPPEVPEDFDNPNFSLHKRASKGETKRGEVDKEGDRIERKLTDIESPQKVDLVAASDIFVTEKLRKSGRVRHKEAALQNLMTRYRHQNAQTDGYQTIHGDFQAAVSKACERKGIHSPSEVAEKRKEAADFALGVESTYRAFSKLDARFEALQRDTPGGERLMHQISTNDAIDAANGIDLVDIIYYEAKDGTLKVIETNFIQVKTPSIEPDEARKIVGAHRDFARELMGGKAELDNTLRIEEIKKDVKSGKFFERMEGSADKKEGVHAVGQLMGEFTELFNLAFDEEVRGNQADPKAEETVAKAVQSCSSLNPAVMKILVEQESFRQAYGFASDVVGSESGDIDIAALQEWASKNPLTPEEVAGLDHGNRLPKQPIGIERINAIILDSGGSRMFVKPLSGGAKALTVK